MKSVFYGRMIYLINHVVCVLIIRIDEWIMVRIALIKSMKVKHGGY